MCNFIQYISIDVFYEFFQLKLKFLFIEIFFLLGNRHYTTGSCPKSGRNKKTLFSNINVKKPVINNEMIISELSKEKKNLETELLNLKNQKIFGDVRFYYFYFFLNFI